MQTLRIPAGDAIAGDCTCENEIVNTVRNGAGPPDAGLGINGDFYIDTTAENIYGPKTLGDWGSPTSLIGPPGVTLLPGGSIGDVQMHSAVNDFEGLNRLRKDDDGNLRHFKRPRHRVDYTSYCSLYDPTLVPLLDVDSGSLERNQPIRRVFDQDAGPPVNVATPIAWLALPGSDDVSETGPSASVITVWADITVGFLNSNDFAFYQLKAVFRRLAGPLATGTLTRRKIKDLTDPDMVDLTGTAAIIALDIVAVNNNTIEVRCTMNTPGTQFFGRYTLQCARMQGL